MSTVTWWYLVSIMIIRIKIRIKIKMIMIIRIMIMIIVSTSDQWRKIRGCFLRTMNTVSPNSGTCADNIITNRENEHPEAR